MTDPLGSGQSATGEAGQSAGSADPGAANAGASGQSAAGTTGTTATDGGQSTVSRAEFDQLRAQLAAADKKRADAEAAHAQLRDKDMPALQKAERDLQVATATLAERDAVITQQRVEIAFLTDNTREWHNPGAALQLLDRSKITVDADGKVMGMKDALTALATAHPYLLKPAPAGDANGGTGQQAPPAGPGTAPANGGIAPQSGTKPTVADLGKRFPALRQRY